MRVAEGEVPGVLTQKHVRREFFGRPGGLFRRL